MFLHPSKIWNLLRGFLVRQGMGRGRGAREKLQRIKYIHLRICHGDNLLIIHSEKQVILEPVLNGTLCKSWNVV